MDVKILSEAEQAELLEYAYRDVSDILLHNGQKAAVDLSTSRVYISQDISQGVRADALPGSLQIASHNLQLSFAPDTAFGDLAAAVEAGHVFKLNVTGGSGTYMQYDVIFTTLPVLRLEGTVTGKNEKGKDLCQGDMCLWTPQDPETGRYSVKTSEAQWHVRGGWSSSLEKTPFKLEVKNSSGDSRNLSMLGLGSDDDWLLNPMNLDDTKLKEKLFSTLWNCRAAEVEWNDKMSAGEYVEVVIDKGYWGLFQLQRRIDGKFLELGEKDVLFKSGSDLTPAGIQEAYELICSGLPREEAYALMEDFFRDADPHIVDMDNFLDVNLFFQCASATDNRQKNIYYILKEQDGAYRLTLLPWDTDMSWGTVWDDSMGFVYDFEESLQADALRREYDWMQKAYPDLDRQMATRWFDLRKDLLTVDTMTAVMQQQMRLLDASGAMKRDEDAWGLYYRGEDSLQKLKQSAEARLEWLDSFYGACLS